MASRYTSLGGIMTTKELITDNIMRTIENVKKINIMTNDYPFIVRVITLDGQRLLITVDKP